MDYRFSAYSDETQNQIREFQETRNPDLFAPILRAIGLYYFPSGAEKGREISTSEIFREATRESLTMMEILLDTQDAFGIKFSENELPHIRSAEALLDLVRTKAMA
jgi:acyl carrier protein